MVIITEGKSDRVFLEHYINFLGLKNIVIYVSGGKDNLRDLFQKIDKGIKQDTRLKIIFDCDDSFSASKANINRQLDKQMQEICEIFLLPNNQDCGNLETLYDEIATHKEVLKCFENYKKCIQNLSQKQKIILPPKKSKLYAYLESFGLSTKNRFLEHNLFDLNHQYLAPLKEFLMR